VRVCSRYPQNHPNRLVLVVEAAPQFIEDLTEQLTSLGYLVVIARSGTEKGPAIAAQSLLEPVAPCCLAGMTLLKSDATTDPCDRDSDASRRSRHFPSG